MFKSLLTHALKGLIMLYRGLISPLKPNCCRFYPSCSAYTHEAIKKHGPFAGSMLGIKRFIKCHPWGASGIDPVPEVKK